MQHKAIVKLAITRAVALALVRGKANTAAFAARLSHEYALLALIVIRDQQLIGMNAKKSGLGDVKPTWATLEDGNAIDDEMMSRS